MVNYKYSRPPFWGIPRSCLKLWIVSNAMAVHALFSLECPAVWAPSLRPSVFYALMAPLDPALVVKGALLSDIRDTWTQALRYCDSWSDKWDSYQVTNGWVIYTVWRQWTKGWFTSWTGRHERFHHTPQKSVQFKTDKLFTSRIFHLIFLDNDWLGVNDVVRIEGPLYVIVRGKEYEGNFLVRNTTRKDPKTKEKLTDLGGEQTHLKWGNTVWWWEESALRILV